MVEVVLCRVLGMLGSVQVVGLSQVSVVSGLLMVARVVVFRRFRMMMGGHAMMMRRCTMLVRCLL